MNKAVEPFEKINGLVEQVNEGYGKIVIEQLVHRLDLTTKDFVREIDELVDRLKKNAAAQEELLGRIKQQEDEKEKSVQVPEPEPIAEVTEWEKRLARLEESAD